MTIQIIDKKLFVFRVGKNDYQFVKPNFLYKNFGTVVKGTVKSSTLGWFIENDFLSDNKLRKELNSPHQVG